MKILTELLRSGKPANVSAFVSTLLVQNGRYGEVFMKNMTTLATAALTETKKNVKLMEVTESFIQLKILLTTIIVSIVSLIIMAGKSSHVFPSALMIQSKKTLSRLNRLMGK